MDRVRMWQQYLSRYDIALLKQRAREQLMESMNRNFALKALCFGVLLFYVGVLYIKAGNPRKQSLSSWSNSNQPIDYGNTYHPSQDKVEEWKRNTWTDWLIQLDDDCKNFNAQIEKEKKAWVEEKEGDWVMLLKHLQNKWLHFNPNLDVEYKVDVLAKSENWDERQWKIWISTEGKQLLEVDLKRWFTNNEMIYCKWTMDEWNEWKNEKIKAWVTTEWKESEDKYWSKFDDASIQTLSLAERNQWANWKERIYREGIEWKNWIAIKESKYVNSNWNSWSEWKNEKRLEFNEWTEAFVEMWITQKQWLIWTDERKDFASRERAAAKFGATGGAASPSGAAAPSGADAPSGAVSPSGADAPSGAVSPSGAAAPSGAASSSGFDNRPRFGSSSGYDNRPRFGSSSGYDNRPRFGSSSGYDNRPRFGSSSGYATPVSSEAAPVSSETTPVSSTEAPVAEPPAAESATKKEEPAAEALLATKPAQTESVTSQGESSTTSL
ncbi:hypothetical protein C922_05316 [Plasmodium inui San Antonio 1]|uniref:Tryptophan/threonine-rich plasmodium antigen C-terminal domain-containing protein n=1 Tax=Plasmodium inui San Antonio 1 TaxID=1237626 RepID=W7AG64_9APIC|nr:hypothetical protein C922_05316 [Plasmodium inui San Antonio 1]EUD64301.1 hypothetical protein C922_05316 [Plasmodium inui San Antonio 1]